MASAAAGIGEFAALEMLGPISYFALEGAPALGSFAVNAYDTIDKYGRNLQRQQRNVPFQNATFLDSQQTYTMRQAGMNLARQGKYAQQAAMLGNEAQSVSYMGR